MSLAVAGRAVRRRRIRSRGWVPENAAVSGSPVGFRQKGDVTRGFGVSVRVFRGPSPDGIRSGRPVVGDAICVRRQVGAVAGRAAWVAAGQLAPTVLSGPRKTA